MIEEDGRIPKDKSLPRSHEGHSALQSINQMDGLTWLRKKRFKSVASNGGGRLTVKKPPGEGLDGWYSLGYVGVEQRVVGDDDGRGAFKDRGLFTLGDGFADFSLNILRNRGFGQGAGAVAELLYNVADFNGMPAPYYKITMRTTVYGKKFETAYVVYLARAIPGPIIYLTGLALSAVPVRVSGTRVGLGLGFVEINEDGLYKFAYVFDQRDTTYLLPVPTDDYQYAADFKPYRTSPTGVIGWGQYFRNCHIPGVSGYPDPPPHPIDNSATKGYVILFSADAGVNWTDDATSTTFFEEFDNTIKILLPDPDVNSGSCRAFNDAVFGMQLEVAPISPRYALCIGVVVYTEVTPPADNVYPALKAKVKLGMIDSASKTVFSTLTLLEADNIQAAWDYFGLGGIVPIDGGACFIVRPDNGSHDAGTYNPIIGFTFDGVSINYSVPLPWISRNIGVLQVIGRHELGLCIYDPAEGYLLMSSKDHGNTWTTRASLSKDGLPPEDDFDNTRDFVYVTQLRDEGSPANPTPGAPWITDSSFTAPIL